MADFYVVHAKALEAAQGKLRVGQQWHIALREIFPIVTIKPELVKPVPIPIVRFTALPDGRLEPSSIEDRALIADWSARYCDTQDEEFTFLPRSYVRRYARAANV